jgi:hypothetical protein
LRRYWATTRAHAEAPQAEEPQKVKTSHFDLVVSKASA